MQHDVMTSNYSTDGINMFAYHRGSSGYDHELNIGAHLSGLDDQTEGGAYTPESTGAKIRAADEAAVGAVDGAAVNDNKPGRGKDRGEAHQDFGTTYYVRLAGKRKGSSTPRSRLTGAPAKT